MSNPDRVIALGSLLACLAIALGAFGAHGLKSVLSEYQLGIYDTAVQYHLAHALGLLLLGVLIRTEPQRNHTLSVWLMFIGILLFSGSLYALSLTGIRWLGMITPIGGLCFLLAWLTLGINYLRRT